MTWLFAGWVKRKRKRSGKEIDLISSMVRGVLLSLISQKRRMESTPRITNPRHRGKFSSKGRFPFLAVKLISVRSDGNRSGPHFDKKDVEQMGKSRVKLNFPNGSRASPWVE